MTSEKEYLRDAATALLGDLEILSKAVVLVLASCDGLCAAILSDTATLAQIRILQRDAAALRSDMGKIHPRIQVARQNIALAEMSGTAPPTGDAPRH